MKVAIYTWHGCVLDVTQVNKLDIAYVSDETHANVAFVNTHAQLEAMRDEAYATATTTTTATTSALDNNNGQQQQQGGEDSAAAAAGAGRGPRVLLVGPADSGKTSLARTLLAYAIKVGRTPLLVDIDVTQNMLSVPGTLAALAPTPDMIAVDGYAYSPSSIMTGPSSSSSAVGSASASGGTQPIVLWYGTQDITSHPDLYKSQITKLGSLINNRTSHDIDMNASGIIVNTSGMIEDVGYQYLLHAIDEFNINVVLVLGHDRLYSMLGTHFKKNNKIVLPSNDDMMMGGVERSGAAAAQSSPPPPPPPPPKIIKLPRSGGVSERDSTFRRISRSSCIKRYFYGSDITTTTTTTAPPSSTRLYSPCLLEIKLSDINIHQITNISLSSALLAIGAKQSTDPIQLITLSSSDITTKYQHALLGVCHPGAVEKYESSTAAAAAAGGGSARDLWLSGVAGFVVVEKVNVDAGTISLLCPCAGSLPSCHLLIGDVYWME